MLYCFYAPYSSICLTTIPQIDEVLVEINLSVEILYGCVKKNVE